ncbi:MAG TPA: adenylate/guanylate cyclase domain-containing protein [Flavobacteriales bacterium]|nr:adenylate/guanylate cyclase domain-containing protein [Flavobacteriales bacterium]
MKRVDLLLLACLLYLTTAHAQLARSVSLEKELARHRKEDAAKAYLMAELAKTVSTIDPDRAFALSEQAVALAQRLKDDKALAAAWVSQRWALYYQGFYQRCDSVNKLAAAAAKRTGDARSWLLAYGAPHYISGSKDSAVCAKMAMRMRRALQIADSLGEGELAGEVLLWHGMKPWGRPNARALEEAMVRYRSAGDSTGVGMCLFCIRSFEPYSTDRALNQRCIEQATALFDLDGNTLWSLWGHSELSGMATEQADYKTAVQEGLEAFRRAEQLGMEREMLGASNALASAYRDIGDVRAALDLDLRGLELVSELDEWLAVRNQLGRTYRLFGMPDSAAFHLRSSLKIIEEKLIRTPGYSRWRQFEAEGYLAEVLAAQGQVTEAARLFRSALQGHRSDGGNYMQEIWASLGYGHLLANASADQLKAMDIERSTAEREARLLIERALGLARQLRMLKEQQDALFDLARLYEHDGDVTKALEYQKLYTVMKDSVLNADKAKAVANLQIQYETEKKEQQIVLLGKEKEVQQQEIAKQKVVRNGFMAGFALVAVFAVVFLFQRNRINKARKRSDELLLNILPEEVAEELKAKGEAEAVHIDQVTVLFTDFKGFTAMSEVVTPRQLVHDLHECFSAFDRICDKHGIEKIKTIGDAYMAAGGLPTPNTTHATDVINAAFEMRDFIAEGKAHKIAASLPYFEIRIGIHTGPVVAGIVGVKKFQYDIWGDTVNTASRMESSGEVGQVNISEATYALVKDVKKVREVNGEWSIVNGGSTHSPTPVHHSPATAHSPFTNSHSPAFAFTPRGKVQAKGKGEMEMYFVQRSSGTSDSAPTSTGT